MKHWYLFLSLIISLYAVATSGQVPITKFTLTGHTFQKGKAVLLAYTNRSEFVPYDSVEMKNGSFSFSGTLAEPQSFMVQAGRRNRIVFIGNENITVTEKDSVTGEMDVTGSPLTNDYDSYFNRWLAPLIQKLQRVNEAIARLDATHQKELDSLNFIQSHLFAHVPDSTIVFIREHPNSFVSLYFLNYYSDAYNVILMNTLFKNLNQNLKQYPSAEFVKQKIEFGLHQSAKCPAFSVPDTSGHLLSLQTFRGQYLLINFWASWCAPCLKNLPYVQKAADAFLNKNFKVLTASLDSDEKTWKGALRKYHLNLNGANVFLPDSFRNPMALQFNLSFIPYNVLVDPAGNIIARNIEGEELLQKLHSMLDKAPKEEQAADNIRTTVPEPE